MARQAAMEAYTEAENFKKFELVYANASAMIGERALAEIQERDLRNGQLVHECGLMQTAIQNFRNHAAIYAAKTEEQQKQHEDDARQCVTRVHELQGELQACKTEFGNQNLQIQEMMKVLQQIPEAERRFEQLTRLYL